MSLFPTTRMRRLRQTPALREMVAETDVKQSQLIYPIFVEEDVDEQSPISSMPGIVRYPESQLAAAVKDAQKHGVQHILLFGVSHHKDSIGSDSMKQEGLLGRMIKRAKDAAPEMTVIADVCFCEYTDHGHCGVVHPDGHVHNDETLDNLATQALVCARAGADIIAPSAMMDGQISAIRAALDSDGFDDIPVMAYSSKFASAMYGPFRAAAGSSLKGDRKAYQMDMRNGREALRESLLDEAEGADILMVKPALAYLDVIANVRANSLLPLAAYQVSGEYAMIKFAAHAGAIDEARVVRETLTSIKRAGADIIISYFAKDFEKYFRG